MALRGAGLKAQIILGSSHLNFHCWSSASSSHPYPALEPTWADPASQHLSKAKRGSNKAEDGPCREMVARFSQCPCAWWGPLQGLEPQEDPEHTSTLGLCCVWTSSDMTKVP